MMMMMMMMMMMIMVMVILTMMIKNQIKINDKIEHCFRVSMTLISSSKRLVYSNHKNDVMTPMKSPSILSLIFTCL